jgi:hypothetical protein
MLLLLIPANCLIRLALHTRVKRQLHSCGWPV